jgi:hypothetical protein
LQGFLQRLDLLEPILQFGVARSQLPVFDACLERPFHQIDQGLRAGIQVADCAQRFQAAFERFHAVVAFEQGGQLKAPGIVEPGIFQVGQLASALLGG